MRNAFVTAIAVAALAGLTMPSVFAQSGGGSGGGAGGSAGSAGSAGGGVGGYSAVRARGPYRRAFVLSR